MKKLIMIFIVSLLTISLFAVWIVDYPITEDYSWVDSNGETHSIHELVDSGKVIVMFWGSSG